MRHGSGLKRGLSKDDLNLSRLVLTVSADVSKKGPAGIRSLSCEKPVSDAAVREHSEERAQINEDPFCQEHIRVPLLRRSKSSRCAPGSHFQLFNFNC